MEIAVVRKMLLSGRCCCQGAAVVMEIDVVKEMAVVTRTI